MAGLLWNRWQLCYGISGRIHLESVAALPWNTQRGQRLILRKAQAMKLLLDRGYVVSLDTLKPTNA
jgi:hypothetical protein